MSSTAISEEVVQKVLDFYKNKEIHRRIHADRVPNFWSIIEYGRKSYETRYSRMLRWLLDPTENHGLKDRFFKTLMKEIKGEGLPLMDLKKTKTETEALANLDILFVSEDPKLTLTIEAKHYATEHSSGEYDSQLEKYFDAIHKQYPDYQNHFIYLTIAGNPPEKTDRNKDKDYLQHYKTLSFEQLSELLIDLEQAAESLDTAKIIRDFRWDVKKSIENHDSNVREIVESYGFKEVRGQLVAFSSYLEGESDEFREDIERKLPQDIQKRYLVEAISLILDNISLQDHTPSPVAQKLAGMIFKKLTDAEKTLELKELLGEEFDDFIYKKAQSTRHPGQGVRLKLADTDYFYSIYLSSGKAKKNQKNKERKTIFPNDGIHIDMYHLDAEKKEPVGVRLNPDNFRIDIRDLLQHKSYSCLGIEDVADFLTSEEKVQHFLDSLPKYLAESIKERKKQLAS
ncbi:PD-(D/E)XK nuclease family protein [Rothia nasimurium]|uniref:PDDEXK-like family protein n=1 Tax=Rothia nasimurium TaxID=85336 RepID=UPI002DD63E74|nr:PD-(D/E)XK nuclease family protein [Rothia nasimurium]